MLNKGIETIKMYQANLSENENEQLGKAVQMSHEVYQSNDDGKKRTKNRENIQVPFGGVDISFKDLIKKVAYEKYTRTTREEVLAIPVFAFFHALSLNESIDKQTNIFKKSSKESDKEGKLNEISQVEKNILY